MTITSLIDLATCQAQLQKFDDALASLKEADVKCKEIKDPSVE
jgi:peroxiredoxin